MRFQLPEELIFLKNRKMPQILSTALMKRQVVVITGACPGPCKRQSYLLPKQTINGLK